MLLSAQIKNDPSNSRSTVNGTLRVVTSIVVDTTNNIIIADGSGSPEGVVTGGIGSLYLRSNGSTGTTLYVKESGTGNTGWVAVTVATAGSTIWRTNDQYATFTPTGTPPIGAFIWDSDAGTLNTKTGASTYAPYSLLNGPAVRSTDRFTANNDTLLNWDVLTHPAAALNVLSGTTAYIPAPSNLSVMERGVNVTVVLINTTGAPVTYTYDTEFVSDTDGAAMSPIVLPINTEIVYEFVTETQGSALVLRLVSPLPPAATTSSGTWTPTITNVLNVAASTAHECQYQKIDAQVSFSCWVEIDATATGTTSIGISLPFASNFSELGKAAGTGAGTSLIPMVGGVYADTTNDRLTLYYDSSTLSNTNFFITGMYTIE